MSKLAVAARQPATPRVASATVPWLPAFVVAAGWITTWLLNFALASSAWVSDVMAWAILTLVAWVIGGPLTAALLRWSYPGLPTQRVVLLGVGWPVCMLFGLVGPFGLRLSAEGAGLLGLGVAAAGVIAGVALTPLDRPTPWDRVLVFAAGWCAGWLWSGVTAWPGAFFYVANGYVNTFSQLLANVPLPLLLAGPLGSGVIGGILGYALFLKPPRAS